MKYLKWEKEKKKKPKTPVQNSMCSEIFIKNEGDNDFLEKKKSGGEPQQGHLLPVELFHRNS